MFKDRLLRTVTLLYLLLCLFLFAGGWYLFDLARSNDLKVAKDDLQVTLNVTQKTLSGLIQRNQTILDAFFSARSQQLEKLARHPDDKVLGQLAVQLRRIMPTMFAMNIMGPNGEFEVPDFNGKIDQVCREDTRLALLHGKYLHRLHPNNLGLHYDTFYRFEIHGEPYMVMASIRVTEIRQILALADGKQFRVFIQSPLDNGQQLLLGADGLTGESDHPCLKEAIIRDTLPLPYSDMSLVAAVNPVFLREQQNERLLSMLPILLVALIVITLMWLKLLRMASLQVRQQHELKSLYAELEAKNVRLMDQAQHDPLTGLNNRGYFDQRLRESWFQQARRESSLAVILFDIDFFKRWNDTYGHAVGDQVLKQVAAELQEHFKRHGDVVARYGGEEFVALLSDTDLEDACRLAESLRQRVEAMALPPPLEGHVTISLGVEAVIPDPGRAPEALVGRADILLYRAKSLGRNRVMCGGAMSADSSENQDG